MAVRTGYKKGDITRLRDQIAAHRVALKAHVPDVRLYGLSLVCGCSNCIPDEAYRTLTSKPLSQFTRTDVAFYFGGAGVLEPDTSSVARVEALGIYLHVLDALAEAVLADRDTERDYKRAYDFVEPSYWLEPLYVTGFRADFTKRHRDLLTAFFADVFELGIAKNHARLTDVMVYVSRGIGGLADLLDGVKKGAPRRQLAFWIAVAGWEPNSPAGQKNAGVSDFFRSFDFMELEDVHRLEDALADGATGDLLDRYAYGARDAEWLAFLSRLVSWRENTIVQNAANRANPSLERRF